MTPLDSIKKNLNKNRVKITRPNTPTKFKTVKASKKISYSSTQGKSQRLKLWIFVGGTTFIIFLGWIFLLRFQLAGELKKGGGFREIGQGFNKIFQTIDNGWVQIRKTWSSTLESSSSQNNQNNNLSAEEIKNLEEKVFPQFTNSNLNQKAK